MFSQSDSNCQTNTLLHLLEMDYQGPELLLCMEHNEVPKDIQCSKSYTSSDKRMSNRTSVLCRVLLDINGIVFIGRITSQLPSMKWGVPSQVLLNNQCPPLSQHGLHHSAIIPFGSLLLPLLWHSLVAQQWPATHEQWLQPYSFFQRPSVFGCQYFKSCFFLLCSC